MTDENPTAQKPPKSKPRQRRNFKDLQGRVNIAIALLGVVDDSTDGQANIKLIQKAIDVLKGTD